MQNELTQLNTWSLAIGCLVLILSMLRKHVTTTTVDVPRITSNWFADNTRQTTSGKCELLLLKKNVERI